MYLFIETFNEMLKQNYLEYNRDFKLKENGELAIFLKGIAGTFKKVFKTINPSDIYIPGMKEINDSSKKHNCSPQQSVTFKNRESKRCLIIAPEPTEEMRNYTFILVEKYKKEYDQLNPTKAVKEESDKKAKAIL